MVPSAVKAYSGYSQRDNVVYVGATGAPMLIVEPLVDMLIAPVADKLETAGAESCTEPPE